MSDIHIIVISQLIFLQNNLHELVMCVSVKLNTRVLLIQLDRFIQKTFERQTPAAM